MYKDLQARAQLSIVLLLKPFFWWRSRCRCRRGLLKFPNKDGSCYGITCVESVYLSVKMM